MNLDKARWYISFLVPVIGVTFFSWNTFSILFFFCIESLLFGLFFVLKGLIGIYYSRKLKGVLFLIFFCGLYFVHILLLTVIVGDIGKYFNAMLIPSYLNMSMIFLLLLIPNIHELVCFYKVSKKSDTTLKNFGHVVDMIFDFKETMLRIFILWLTLPFVFGIIYADMYWHPPFMISKIVAIIIFATIQFSVDSYSKKEREKVESLSNKILS
jgi:hypothetical protein